MQSWKPARTRNRLNATPDLLDACLARRRQLVSLPRAENPEAAKRAAKTIRQGVTILREHPQAGRPAEDMPQNIRELVIGFGASAHVVVYGCQADDVVILSVRHARDAGYR